MRVLAVLTLTLAVCGTARGNLISNGSFEQSCLTTHSQLYVAVAPGSSCITGWTVLDDSVHYVDSGWQASDGLRSLDLDGPPGTAGAVSSPFATTPGARYLLTFDMAGNPAAPPESKSMRVSVSGQSEMFVFDIGAGAHIQSLNDMGWVHKQMYFTANSNSSVVEFKSIPVAGVQAGWGPALDNVNVERAAVIEAVPEPAAVVLVAPALLALVTLRRRLLGRRD